MGRNKLGLFDHSIESAFKDHDPILYYCMIRHFKPERIIEVGIGESTKIAALAAKRNNATLITAIDPYYNSQIEGIEQIRKPVQDIPLSEFRSLKENDILFIDSSHVSKVASDVNYLFLDVLPRLREGVLIHIHDIHLPDEMPRDWIRSKAIFWNEQYLLHAFLIFNSKFRILVSNHFMAKYYKKKLCDFYSCEPAGGSSFWIQKNNNSIGHSIGQLVSSIKGA